MLRSLIGAWALVALLCVNVDAQQVIQPKAWGSLTGKVTLNGDVPAVIDLKPKMMLHADKACCLAANAKPEETVDQTWVVDPKTKAVANVMVYLVAPAGMAYPTHKDLKKRPNVLVDQPHCAFIPRMSGYNPLTFDEAAGKFVPTGQKLTIKNSAVVTHNIRGIGQLKYNKGFNENLPPKTETVKSLNPQPLPLSLQCDIHPWMQARLFVFDHPYYAVTNKEGVFELPYVPAGVEIFVAGYHEDVGYLLTKQGQKMTLKEGKNTFDFQIQK